MADKCTLQIFNIYFKAFPQASVDREIRQIDRHGCTDTYSSQPGFKNTELLIL